MGKAFLIWGGVAILFIVVGGVLWYYNSIHVEDYPPYSFVCGNAECEVGEFTTCPQDCSCTYFTGADNSTEFNCASTVVWNEQYDADRRVAGVSDQYLMETEKYDFSSPKIQNILLEMKQANLQNTYEAIVWAAQYVNTYTSYDFKQLICEYGSSNPLCDPSFASCESNEKCKYSSTNNVYRCTDTAGYVCEHDTASSVLDRGCGWCSTQSYAVIAILRGAGIAAKQMRGCVSTSITCLGADGKPMIIKDEVPHVLPDGRVEIGSGGAHSWVMAWSNSIPDGSKGWVIVESTSGRVKPGSCLQYQSYGESIDGEGVCYIRGDEVTECNKFCGGCIPL